MSLADVDVAVGRKCDHHRLPEQPLTPRFVPITSAAALPERQQQLALRIDLHDRGGIRRGDPDVVVAIDRHAMRLVLVADDVRTDLQKKPVARVELEQLRLPRVGSLKDPQVVLRIERDGRNSTEARGQDVRIGERIAQRLLPLDTLQRLPAHATPPAAEWRATAWWRVHNVWRNRASRSAGPPTACRHGDAPVWVDDRPPGWIRKGTLQKPAR